MHIGIDVMGGDYAPEVAVLGTLDAARAMPDCTFVLFGNRDDIEKYISLESDLPTNYEIVHASEVIGMSDSPTSAFQRKPDSSIVVGFTHLQNGDIDGFASAGNTGAMMVGCVHLVKAIDGVMRPTIATALPTFTGKTVILMDAGLNIDVKPEVLCQYGLLGSIYAERVFGINNPKIALLNIGEEEEKGNAQSKAAHQLMKQHNGYNFIGNIEGKSFLSGDADVIVCDGFTGNIVLKLIESFYPVIEDNKQLNSQFISGINYEFYGGVPVLGVNSTVIVGHGCSSRKAIKNMAITTAEVAKSSMIKDIKEKIK